MASADGVRWHHLYRFGVGTGVRTLFLGRLDLGLRAILNPVRSGFVRYIEIPYVINALAPGPQDDVLDVASPKHASLFTGVVCGSRVKAIDILPDFLEPYRTYARSLGEANIQWASMDGTSLDYPDRSFDKAFSISALEHFVEDGDMAAVREIARVLRPGGVCAITVPFSLQARNVFKTTDVYEREFSGEPVFFCRMYDLESLRGRIIEPAGWVEIDRRYYRNRWGIEEMWERLPRAVHMALHWLGPLLAAMGYERVDQDCAETGICCLTLRKESPRPS